MDSLSKTSFPQLKLMARGKVRDIYDLGNSLLIIATDRLSAFDVILPTAIAGRGIVLTQLSLFWLNFFRTVLPNHLLTADTDEIIKKAGLEDVPEIRQQLEGRAMLVKKCRVLPVECIVRGHIIGSGWKDYQKTGAICGLALPEGLKLADRLPQPIFTPSTKAEQGQHDENISFERCEEIVGKDIAFKLRSMSLAIFSMAADFALPRGVIIADTKFEFGLDEQGNIVLIDEVLTPDSSRFWPAEDWLPGQNPPSFDKQIVRDYLETLSWDKTDPGPDLPVEIAERTRLRYMEVHRLLTNAAMPELATN